ncbi:MAG: phosphate ABC transporter permease subunit PstC [Clostridia bacterium]|nr:phosphate ABC transporter permease subunit PstC [Clostridia bacterium]
MKNQVREGAARVLLAAAALSSLAFLIGIILVLFREALPALRGVGLAEFAFGTEWYPTSNPPSFGALPLIAASLQVTVGSMAIAVPLGLLSAMFMSQVLPASIRQIVKPAVELLAGLPSVVYGLFGMQFAAPAVMRIFHLPTGLTALTASIVLGIMALPTVASIAEDAFSSVPSAYKEASVALGATTWETVSRVVVPVALPGVVTAVLLGISRAIGETMTVLMVAGGSARVPTSFLQPVRPMTATIAAEMGETPVGSLHYQALFVLAAGLFVITLLFNLVAQRLTAKFRAKVG